MRQNINKSVRDNSFNKAFKNIQLSGLYALYYDIDLTKEDIQNFSDILVDYNVRIQDVNDELNLDTIKIHSINLGFNTMEEALKFPLRAKIKMSEIKNQYAFQGMKDINDAINYYLLLALYALSNNFETVDHREWWNAVIEFSKNYAEGMTDQHVIKYFKQECNL